MVPGRDVMAHSVFFAIDRVVVSPSDSTREHDVCENTFCGMWMGDWAHQRVKSVGEAEGPRPVDGWKATPLWAWLSAIGEPSGERVSTLFQDTVMAARERQVTMSKTMYIGNDMPLPTDVGQGVANVGD